MKKTPRSLAVAGLALAAGLGVVATAAPAFAAQDPILTEEQQSTLQAQVDAYKACLEQQGVTLPEKSADGTKPELTEEQRQAMRAAHEACEDQEPQRPELSDAQQTALKAQQDEYRACMDEQLSAAGITRPEKPAAGAQPSGDQAQGPSSQGQRPERPQPSDEQKAAMEAARDACADLEPNLGVDGIGPMGGGHGGPGGRMGPGGPQGQSGQSGQSSQSGRQGPSGQSGSNDQSGSGRSAGGGTV